jgi:hypothetical protein
MPFANIIFSLQPIKEFTERFSRKDVPVISDVLFTFDQLHDHFEGKRDDPLVPEHLRCASIRALKVLNKYYSLTDQSDIFRIAMSMSLCFHC